MYMYTIYCPYTAVLRKHSGELYLEKFVRYWWAAGGCTSNSQSLTFGSSQLCNAVTGRVCWTF